MGATDLRMPGPGDEATWGPMTGHPNDPRNDSEGLDEIIASEADAILAECATMDGALDFDYDYEPLANHTSEILNIVGMTMENRTFNGKPLFKDERERFEHIGHEVYRVVMQAAEKAARSRIERGGV